MLIRLPLMAHGAVVRTLGAAVLCSTSHCGAAQSVPVRLIDGLPVVEVQLGAVRADFLLDTGGQIGLTVPEPLITASTGVSLRPERRKTGDAAGHTFDVQTLRASSVRLEGVELGPVDGLIAYRWGLKIGDGAAPDVTKKGAIGLRALSSRNLMLDMGKRRIVLYDRDGVDRPNVTGWQQIPFKYDARGIVVTLSVDGTHATMALDSAATTSMIRKDAAIFKGMKSPCKLRTPDSDYCGSVKLQPLRAGDQPLKPLTVAVVKMAGVPFDGLLGIDFFMERQVFVDFDAMLLSVK